MGEKSVSKENGGKESGGEEVSSPGNISCYDTPKSKYTMVLPVEKFISHSLHFLLTSGSAGLLPSNDLGSRLLQPSGLDPN